VQSALTSSNSLQKATRFNGRISAVSSGKVAGAVQNGPQSPIGQNGCPLSDSLATLGWSDTGENELISREITPARATDQAAFRLI
jgi:hypothetical protein